MKTVLCLALAFCLGLAGCTPAAYQPSQGYGYYGYPEPYQGPSVPGPWIYNYDPTMRQWYEMPYYNPYRQ